MRRTTRYFTGLLAATTLIVGLGAGTAHAGQITPPLVFDPNTSVKIPAPAVPPAKTVAAGMRIAFDDYTNYGSACTIGAVGTDSQNRKVGITAGHCSPHPLDTVYPGPAPQTPVSGNAHPVWDWRDVAAGPIGWIRYTSFDKTLGFEANSGPLDYMVIEFADNVTLSSQLMTTPQYAEPHEVDDARDPGNVIVPSQPWWKMNEIYSDAAGNPTNPAVNQTLCHVGSFMTQHYAQSGNPWQARCGRIKNVGGGYLDADALSLLGDSGGPAFIQGSQDNKWVGIVSKKWYGFWGLDVHYIYTSAKKILDDLNPRGITGSGFQITNN